ncbi:200 kDa antigen p200, putative [Burkholderia pseudomallei 1710b]|uniref:200 kDa antigen p200, putative n=1 Tax=Burkholderia pseudomallei (strain 1710b) TaxID=320372 RepID=Q3JUT5_BURP1|nr:200 kDa antigen p200, putative [Burkholderia pseudomallei 1710b]
MPPRARALALCAGGRAPAAPARRRSGLDVLETEDLGLVVVRKDLAVTAPVDHRVERLLSRAVRQEILELLLEAHARRAMPGPLVQHFLDPRGERHVAQQMLGEHHLALLRAEFGEHAPRRRQEHVALAHVGEAQVLQHFGDREQIVDLEVQRAGDLGHVRAAVVRRRGERLDETRHQVRRHLRQPAAELEPLLRRLADLARGHLRVDVVDEAPERRVEPVARMLERHLDLRDHAARIRRQHENPVAHEHRFLDVVRDDQHRLDRHPALRPQIEQIGAQRLGRQHVERGERLVHQEQRRIDDERAREAHALAHAARQLARVRVLEAVEADQVDRGERALAPLARADAERLEPRLDVLQHGEPRKQREGLEHHRDAFGRAGQRLAEVRDLAARRLDQPGDDPQERRLAGARAAEQPDDLAFAQRQVRAVEHEQLALRLVEAAAHVLDAQDFLADPRRRGRRLDGGVDSIRVLHRVSLSVGLNRLTSVSNLCQSRRSFASAYAYSGRHNRRLNKVTNRDITAMPRMIFG